MTNRMALPIRSKMKTTRDKPLEIVTSGMHKDP